MEKKYKIGILGFGSMGRTHSYSVASVPYHFLGCPFSAEYVSVCTSNEKTAKAAAQQFKIARYTVDENEVINDPDIDIIDISTPNIFDYESAKKAILAGKHVLCEKPLAISATEAEELARLADEAYKENGQICGLVFNNRHLPAIKRAKLLCNEGRLGRILSFDFKYLHNSCIDPQRTVGWKQDASVCGAGTLFDLGSHAIDLCRYLCGEFDSVYAKEQIAFPTHKTADGSEWRTNADEATYITATLKCGAVGTITVGKINVGACDDLSFTIYGTKGSVKFDLMDPNWLYYYDAEGEGGAFGGFRGYTRIECVGNFEAPGGKFPSPKAPIGWLRGHIGSMYSFLDSIYQGKPACPSFADGAAVQAILDAAHRSHVEKKEIKL